MNLLILLLMLATVVAVGLALVADFMWTGTGTHRATVPGQPHHHTPPRHAAPKRVAVPAEPVGAAT